MVFYVASVERAFVTQSGWCEVTCEQCHTRYAYQLVRVGFGTASNHYCVMGASARRNAQKLAGKQVQKHMARGSEIAPCPKCGWLQKAMVQEIVRRMSRQASKMDRVLGVASAALALLAWCVAIDSQAIVAWRTVHASAAVALACLVTMVVRSIWRWMTNPNADYNGKPRVIPGAVTTYYIAESDKDGRDPTMAQEAKPLEKSGWLEVPLAHLSLPPVCCSCGGGATTHLRHAFSVDTPHEFPACADCALRFRRSDLLWTWAGVVLALIPAGLLYALTPGLGEMGRPVIAFFLWGFAAMVLALKLPRARPLPVRTRDGDGQRGTCWMKFANLHFEDAVRALIRSSL